MKTYNFEISEIANQFGANVQESCNSMSGYPSDLRPCIVGFEHMDEANDAVKSLRQAINDEDVTVEIVHLRKRDGWHMWYRGAAAYEMYDMEGGLNDYEMTFRKDEADYYLNEERAERLAGLKEDDEDFDVETYNANTEKVHAAILGLSDGQVLVIDNEHWEDGYFEIRQAKTMHYHEDVITYEIGISINW